MSIGYWIVRTLFIICFGVSLILAKKLESAGDTSEI